MLNYIGRGLVIAVLMGLGFSMHRLLGGHESGAASCSIRQTQACACQTAQSSFLLWRHGKFILLVLLMCALVAGYFQSKVLGLLVLVGLAFSLYFFRSPTRVCRAALEDTQVIVCPADGKIVAIETEENYFVGAQAQRISIFLSPLDVHVQWAPCAGVIAHLNYRPGAFLLAYAPKSSEVNERNDMCLVTESGKKMVVRQIAGFVARRIVTWVHEQELVEQNFKYGMIRFGSRVDLILPPDVTILVKVGDVVRGGETAIGRWGVLDEQSRNTHS